MLKICPMRQALNAPATLTRAPAARKYCVRLETPPTLLKQKAGQRMLTGFAPEVAVKVAVAAQVLRALFGSNVWAALAWADLCAVVFVWLSGRIFSLPETVARKGLLLCVVIAVGAITQT